MNIYTRSTVMYAWYDRLGWQPDLDDDLGAPDDETLYADDWPDPSLPVSLLEDYEPLCDGDEDAPEIRAEIRAEVQVYLEGDPERIFHARYYLLRRRTA